MRANARSSPGCSDHRQRERERTSSICKAVARCQQVSGAVLGLIVADQRERRVSREMQKSLTGGRLAGAAAISK